MRSALRPWLAVTAAALGCGRTLPYELVPAPEPPPGPAACTFGGLRGRICAPDGKTWLNGAAVSVSAHDCNGQQVEATTTTAADGTFLLEGVPAGPWNVTAQLGPFSQTTLAVVVANTVSELPTHDLCLGQQSVKIAVVTGSGDKIENLLGSLKLTYSTFGGTKSTWTNNAAAFLGDRQKLESYDLVFIDCDAASTGGYHLDLGDAAPQIEENLRHYVLNGGSLYASDWALLFAQYAAPDALSFLTDVPTPIATPFDTTHLMGFAPQTVSASVTDPALATFLGKSTLSINFPDHNNAVALHWGLIAQAPNAVVLATADQVATCGDPSCTARGATRDSVPLAVRLKLTPESERGGQLVYTSFHNIAQSGDDVARLLKYLVLNL